MRVYAGIYEKSTQKQNDSKYERDRYGTMYAWIMSVRLPKNRSAGKIYSGWRRAADGKYGGVKRFCKNLC